MATPPYLSGTDEIEPQDLLSVWSSRNRDARRVSFAQFRDAVADSVENDLIIAVESANSSAEIAQGIADNLSADLSDKANKSDLAATSGAGLVGTTEGTVQAALTERVKTSTLSSNTALSAIGFIASGVASVTRTALDKIRDQLSIKDKGAAVDGVTDDTAAINAARASVANQGGAILFGGKTYASGFFENLSPLVQEWIVGAPGVYVADMVATKPVTSHKVFNGTPQAGGGFAAFGHRVDTYTKTGVDVASTVGLASVVNSLSNNSGGSATTNNTNQVAILASAAAQSATASAPVTGINAIATSAYSGSTWQPVVGVESDIAVTNPPGFFGQAGTSTGIGYSAVLSGSSTQNGTAAYASDTSKVGKGFLYGSYLAGIVNAGVVVARNTITPDSGVYVSAAKTYGIYVGAKQLYDLGPGKNPTYDTDHNPAVAIALGQTAAVNGRSGYLRFVQTDGAGAELTTDIYRDGTALQIAMNGVIRLTVSSTGAILINGQQVLAGRQTGWSQMTGTADRSTVINSDTATLQQQGRMLKAITDLLFTQGIAGT